MTVLDLIQQQLKVLPPDKQAEVLDFVAFLRERAAQPPPAQPRPLREHPAFGAWRARGIDALQYQERLRAEWDAR